MLTQTKKFAATLTVAATLSGCFPTVSRPAVRSADYDSGDGLTGNLHSLSIPAANIPDAPEPVPGEENPGKVVAVIKKGQRAPFTGLLFSPEASAETIVELKQAQKMCDIECTKKLEIARVNHELELARLQASYDALESGCKVRIATRDETIEFMEKKLENIDEPNTVAWFAGGAAGGLFLGIALALGVFATTNEIE